MDWIRVRNFIISGTSYFWNGFIRILSWITGQLGWKVGNGLNIRLGIDPIDGLDSSFILLMDLRDYLSDFGIIVLAHPQNLEGPSTWLNYWYSATDLCLGGVWPINGLLLSMACVTMALDWEITRTLCSGCLIKRWEWYRQKKLMNLSCMSICI